VPKVEVEIVNKLGLHARASAKLTQMAGSYPCEVWMERGSRRINAKSIMGVMMLAAGKGAKVIIDCEGERADEALASLQALVAGRFGEHE
jgi:phosphocarrier protein